MISLDCEEAIRLCPSYIRAYTRLGGIYNTLKQYQKAIEVDVLTCCVYWIDMRKASTMSLITPPC